MVARRGTPKIDIRKNNQLSRFGVRGAVARWGKRTIAERLWALVNIGPPTDCWTWKRKTVNRYPVLVVRGVNYLASRVAYVLETGKPLHPNEYVLHRCDNSQCVNPNHLFIGTQRENMQDMVRKGRWKRPLEYPNRKGIIHPVKLNWEKISYIRDQAAKGAVQADIARYCCVSTAMISRIVRNLAWQSHLR